MRKHYDIAVLPVIQDVSPNCLAEQLDLVKQWYRNISRGNCRLSFQLLPVAQLNYPLNHYAVSGGMGHPPRNSQRLVRDALLYMKAAHGSLALLAPNLLVLSNDKIKPHTWHLRNGGHHLENGRWCRRYAIIPANATLGMTAHELGHLLFDWPDLAWEKSLGEACLMARGATRSSGRSPSPPCAPLRVGQGWIDPIAINYSTTVEELATEKIGIVNWQQNNVFVEYRSRHERANLLVYTCKGQKKRLHPKIIGCIRLTDADHTNSVLGLIAPKLRSCLSYKAVRPESRF
jgi:hypothetical protein